MGVVDTFGPGQQIRQQELRAYCPTIYTVGKLFINLSSSFVIKVFYTAWTVERSIKNDFVSKKVSM
jgi:hypothetical protein